MFMRLRPEVPFPYDKRFFEVMSFGLFWLGRSAADNAIIIKPDSYFISRTGNS